MYLGQTQVSIAPWFQQFGFDLPPQVTATGGVPVREIVSAEIQYGAAKAPGAMDWLRKYKTAVFVGAGLLLVMAVAKRRL